jgi:bifunctional NMN adenylyltransferase/nudix hydrolase
LLEHVIGQSDKVIIFLGYKVNQPDRKNPFTLRTRKGMVSQIVREKGYSEATIIDHIEDHPMSNVYWSSELDKKIKAHIDALGYDNAEVTLYGSRDSFIKAYTGDFSTKVIEDAKESGVTISGTQMRSRILSLKDDELTNEHREGIVYGLSQLYRVGMSVVDILIYKKENNETYILLGRKAKENAYRIIGGFFDVEKDNSLEEAALRELEEEAGDIAITNMRYVCSKKIDDWRYKDNDHKIVSSLFLAEYLGGEIQARDDLAELQWVALKDIARTAIVESHTEFIKQGTATLL